MDQEELARAVAVAVAEAIESRRPSYFEAVRKALVNAALSGLGASVAIIIGFWLNGVKQSASDASKYAEEATSIGKQVKAKYDSLEADVQQVKVMTTGHQAASGVIREEIANISARLAVLEKAPDPSGDPAIPMAAAPVTAAAVAETLDKIKKREDKEIYRAQLQLATPPSK